MDPSDTGYHLISETRDLGCQSGRTLLGYEAETGCPRILRPGPSHGYPRSLPPSHFISISPLEYNKAQHNRICDLIWPRFAKKNKANVWRAQLGNVETKKITAAYEHQRTLHALIQSNDWELFSVRRTWSKAKWVSVVWTYWKNDSSRLLELTLTEFEITHPEDRKKPSRLEPLGTTHFIEAGARFLGPSRPRPSGNLPVPVTEEIVGKGSLGERITQYIRARSSVSPLVLFMYDVSWAKRCFPEGSFPEVEEGINSLLYDPPKRYDTSSQPSGGTGWYQPSDRSQDPRRPPSASIREQKPRRDEGRVYLLDLKPAIESVSRFRDSQQDLYSAAQKFGIKVNEEEKNPVHDSLLIVRLWNLVFSGSPKKIREEEVESARKSAQTNPGSKNEPKNEDAKDPPPVQPDDEDVDPNDIPSGPSNVVSNSSAFGKPQTVPEVDWENAFDEDEEDDY